MRRMVGLMCLNIFFLTLGVGAFSAGAAPVEPLYGLAQKEKGPFLDTLKELVSIESGSKDREGLDRISALIADRLRTLGGKVTLIEPGADIYKMFDTPEKPARMVEARFEGKGTKKILLIAHMDTGYLKARLAQQPFRGDGNRAYGPGIVDDKQGDARFFGSRYWPEDELDACQRRHQSQCHSRTGHGSGRRARAAGRRLRGTRGESAGAHGKAPHPRHHGGDEIRAAKASAAADTARRGAGEARAENLRGARKEAQDLDGRRGRRHRCRLRGAEDRESGDRAVRGHSIRHAFHHR